MNDRWHTALHEAGHAVVGRVLGMICGLVTIVEDEDSAGHSICADPWMTLSRWEQCDRYRDAPTAYRGRIMTYMAGAEAEIALVGRCNGGDGDDRWEIDAMIASRHSGAPDDGFEQLEARLRRATAAVVRRHIGKIDALAKALMERGIIVDDDEIRKVAGLPPPLPDGPVWLAMQEAMSDDDDAQPKVVGLATDAVQAMDAAIEGDRTKRRRKVDG